MNQTKIELLRSNSSGIKGTIANAKHHAQAMLPYISAMRHVVGTLGFKTWRQGNNVHEFHTEDGRKFTLRGIIRGEEDTDKPNYIGVRLSLRESRSAEHRLFDIDDLSQVPAMLAMMENLAKPQRGKEGRLMTTCA